MWDLKSKYTIMGTNTRCASGGGFFILSKRSTEWFKVEKWGKGSDFLNMLNVATLLWVKWENETPTPKVGDLESPGTPECLELDSRGQNTSHWGVIGVIGKVLKCRCPKCPRIGHLNICSPSYGQKKGQESNWQFDSQPLKVGNRPLPDIRIGSATWRWKALKESYNFGSDLVLIRLGSQEIWAPKVPGLQPGQFRDSNLGVPGKRAIWM